MIRRVPGSSARVRVVRSASPHELMAVCGAEAVIVPGTYLHERSR